MSLESGLRNLMQLELVKANLFLAICGLLIFCTILNVIVMHWGRKREMGINQGILVAFFMSFFIEMWGIVITVYSVETVLAFQLFNNVAPDLFYQIQTILNYIGEDIGLLYSSEFDEFRILYVKQIGYYMPYILMPVSVSIIVFAFVQVFRAKRKNQLCTTYMYKHIRNPQYWGFILFILGWNLQYPLLISWLIFPYFIVLYIYLAVSEEKILKERFGLVFSDYKRRTGRFIPHLHIRKESTAAILKSIEKKLKQKEKNGI